MSDPSAETNSPETEATAAPTRQGKIGLGTVSILVLFFGIISAMCIGAALIVAVIAFR